MVKGNIAAYNKIAREFKTKNDWVEKVIHWELCKGLKLHDTKKCYLLEAESVQENGAHKILWDFEIQTHHLIPARRPVWLLIKKKERICRFGNLGRFERTTKMQMNKWGKCDYTMTLLENWKTLWNMKVTVIIIVIANSRNELQAPREWIGGIEIGGENRKHSDYRITEINSNPEKS